MEGMEIREELLGLLPEHTYTEPVGHTWSTPQGIWKVFFANADDRRDAVRIYGPNVEISLRGEPTAALVYDLLLTLGAIEG